MGWIGSWSPLGRISTRRLQINGCWPRSVPSALPIRTNPPRLNRLHTHPFSPIPPGPSSFPYITRHQCAPATNPGYLQRNTPVELTRKVYVLGDVGESCKSE